MIYDFNNNPGQTPIQAVSDSLEAAMAFIFEHSVTIELAELGTPRSVGPMTLGEAAGQFLATPTIYGNIRFKYVMDTKNLTCTVEYVEMELGELGWATIPFTTAASLYDSILNRHKLLVTTNSTRPTRMANVSAVCDRLKSIEIPDKPEIQELIRACVADILKEIQ